MILPSNGDFYLQNHESFCRFPYFFPNFIISLFAFVVAVGCIWIPVCISDSNLNRCIYIYVLWHLVHNFMMTIYNAEPFLVTVFKIYAGNTSQSWLLQWIHRQCWSFRNWKQSGWNRKDKSKEGETSLELALNVIYHYLLCFLPSWWCLPWGIFSFCF